MTEITSSVAMATYNGSRYILEQLRSIEEQTVKPDEIVICDDGSSDDTVAVIREYAVQSALDIKLYQNEKNLGFRRNFEKAISLCTKDVVFLCDQDDVWVRDKVERFLNAYACDDKLVYAFSDAYITDQALNITHDSIWAMMNVDWASMDNQTFFDKVQCRVFPLGFSAAARRCFLEQIIPFRMDHDGWIALCAPAFGDIKAIDEKLVYYRRHSNATSDFAKPTGFMRSKLNLVKRIFMTKYQMYFTWPQCEYDDYSTVVVYASTAQLINVDEVIRHLDYLGMINEVQNKDCVSRVWGLWKLYKSGLYQKYRGNAKQLMLDSVFMMANSVKRQANR